MGFCSESLLLFAAFHPGTSENDCLGDLPMIWMAALGPTPTRHFMDFFGGDQPLEWGLGGMTKTEIHTRRFSKVLLFTAWSQAQKWS